MTTIKELKEDNFLISKSLVFASLFLLLVLTIGFIISAVSFQEGKTRGANDLAHAIKTAYDDTKCGNYFLLSQSDVELRLYKEDCFKIADMGNKIDFSNVTTYRMPFCNKGETADDCIKRYETPRELKK
jgi:hypothetical protein